MACGGGEEQASQPGDTSETVESTEGDHTAEAVEETPEDTGPPPLYPEGALDPSQITADTPVSAAALFEAYFIWDGKDVTVEGYPYISYLADSMIVVDEIVLIAEARGSRDILATAVFTDTSGVTIWADQPITISGTAEHTWGDDLGIVNAVIVSGASPAQQNFVTSAYVYDGNTPILVQELNDMFNVWIGKELTVEGYYNCTTVSSRLSGEVISVRVDLGDLDSGSTKFVACEMTDEISEETDSIMLANRAGTRIRGTLTGKTFNMVGLENCVFLNR